MMRKQFRSILNRLAARILRGQVKGVVVSAPTAFDPMENIPGWIYGQDWFIVFPKSPRITFANGKPVKDLPSVVQLPANSPDVRP